MNRINLQEIISSGIFFGTISFILLFLISKNAFSDTEVATLMFVCSFLARGGRILFAPILDQLSVRINFCIFHFGGAIGYLILVFSKSFLLSCVGVILIGFFFAGSNLLVRVLVPDLNKGEMLNKTFAKLHIVTNIATCFSPLAMNLIFDYNMNVSFYIVSIILFISGIISFFSMKDFNLSRQKPFFKNFVRLLFDFKLFKLYFFTIALWFLYAQIFSLVPVLLKQKYSMQI